ncbi:MAG: hypothetical protein Q7S40_11705 [Opitutaceae bacterium]|nr:hypothetical protein [Opitutaceae bacterium]
MFSRPPLGFVCIGFIAGLAPVPLHAWDYDGHRMVNQVALASLPREYPQFVHAVANAERLAFLAGEADRWRNVPDLPLKQYNGVDHYCDMEYIPEAGLDWATVPSFRYDFVVQFAAGRAANAKRFAPIDPAKNTDHSREWPGLAPWAITEYYGKLRAAFSYLKVFEELGTPDEIMNAQANVVYLMGVMGHYVGDCAQPLHTTKHHNGWVGENPKGYTTWPGFHAWIDGGFVAKAGIKPAELAPRVRTAEPIALAARSDGRDPMFVAAVDYLEAQHRLVEPLYQLEKEGKLGNSERPVTDEARVLISGQLLKGGQMLGAIWLTAYRNAIPDTYLRASLIRRQTGASPGSASGPVSAPPAQKG